ncbi:MAG: hypothetical protein FJX78_02755 [Armatimonadetes bacterium]|nr:hypothetical protein [Armatimonadota bacterium]
MAWHLAIASPRIRTDVVEVSEYPELVERYQIRGVPRMIVNESVSFEGAVPEAKFIDAVMRAVAAEVRGGGAGEEGRGGAEGGI